MDCDSPARESSRNGSPTDSGGGLSNNDDLM